MSGSGFCEGGEAFGDSNKAGDFMAVLRDGGSAGRDGRLIRYVVRHLSVCRATCFLAEVSVFGAVDIHNVSLLVGLEDFKLMRRVGVGAE